MYTIHLGGGPRRVNHAAVSIGSAVYSFGGYCTGENYNVRRPIDVHVLSTRNFRWRLITLSSTTVIPFQRYGHTVVAYDNKVYLWGGRNDQNACHTLYCFDPARGSWTAPAVTGHIPLARDGHSACVVDHKMYIFGGFEEAHERFTQDLYSLDLRTMVWQLIRHKGTLPSFRDFHTAAALGSNMYIFGGRSDASGQYHSDEEIYCNRISYFDTISQVWVQPDMTGEVPKGRRSHSAFFYKGQMFVFGGYNGKDDTHFNDLYSFDPSNNTWKLWHLNGTPPCPRRRQSCCLNGDRVFVFGGTSPSTSLDPRRNGPYPEGIIPFDDVDMAVIPNIRSLQDHNDLHILDFCPSLRTLSSLAIVKYKLLVDNLPRNLIKDLEMMTSDNNITPPAHPEPQG